MSLLDDGEVFGQGLVEFENRELQSLYAKAREYEALANEMSISRAEVNELLGDLDSNWPYMQKTVRVTGNVIVATRPDIDSGSDVIPLAPEYFEDVPVESIGFNMMQVASEQGDQLRWIMGHSVIFEMEKTGDLPMLKDYTVKHGFAPLDDVVLTYPFESQCSYFDKMHYRFPEIGADIDTALLNATNESEAIMSLAGLEIMLGLHDTHESFEVLTDYINSVISFDQKVPYQMHFGGSCYMISGVDGKELIPAHAEAGYTLAYPLKVSLFYEDMLNAQTQEKQTIARFGLQIILINENRNEDTGKLYLIPITDELDIHDVRTLVYTALNSQTSD